MNQNRLRLALGLLALGAILFSAVGFTVREGQALLVTRFGDPVSVATEPGLHWKLPWPIELATPIDMRSRVFNTGNSEMLTRDKKNIILLSYAVWRVADPLLFFQSIGSIEAADIKLDGLITNAKIGVLGRYDLSALVSTDPEDLKGDEIEAELLAACTDTALEKYGIAIETVGFKRLSLPKENVRYVFKQMRAERKQYAERYRAEGEQQAAKIRSETDLEAAKIRADGAEESARIRGEAEAEAARIYADAQGEAPELYRFLRSLESLNKVVGDKTTLILRTDSEPFDLLSGAAQ